MQKFGGLSDTKVKILMLGESGVGKSSILLRFADDKFQSGYVVTLGVEYKQKKQVINDKDILIQVWDTAGQEQFRTITPIYYKNVDGVVIVYDVTDEHSFESKKSVTYWMNNLKEYADPKIVGVLVGNKCDMNDKRIIPKEKGQELAQQFKNVLEFTETSAKSAINIQQVFVRLTEEIVKRREQGTAVQHQMGQKIPFGDVPKKKKSSCCSSGGHKK